MCTTSATDRKFHATLFEIFLRIVLAKSGENPFSD